MKHSKCIIILSEKSSGSSALQKLLIQSAPVQLLPCTRHFENETLYWTKAASILNRPQIQMVDSEVPIERSQARAELISLLTDNLIDYIPPEDDIDLIMNGWKLLCEQYSPIFLEKSPHHLCQWSALELVIECIDYLKNVEFLLVGLIRNPLDTIFSQFTRWKSRPEQVQEQWCTAYRNLQKLQSRVGAQLTLVRYEDMVQSIDAMENVLSFCGVSSSTVQHEFYRNSIGQWRRDHLFGFALSQEAIAIATEFGYQKQELINHSYTLWPAVREFIIAKARMQLKRRKPASGGKDRSARL